MGKIKLVLVGLAGLLIALPGAFFITENRHSVVLNLAVSPGSIEASVGSIVVIVFVAGFVTGMLFCLAYIAIQWLESRKCRRLADKYKKELDQLRVSSLKDTA